MTMHFSLGIENEHGWCQEFRGVQERSANKPNVVGGRGDQHVFVSKQCGHSHSEGAAGVRTMYTTLWLWYFLAIFKRFLRQQGRGRGNQLPSEG